MKVVPLVIVAILILPFVHAQQQYYKQVDTTQKLIRLDEVVISASNFKEKKKNVAQQIDIISANNIATLNSQNTGDLLLNTGKIFVQKSQQGGSSPVLRGFEASRILLVVDGIRMNNAIYRSGHLQNIITTDQNSLSRVEVIYGPASTIYGSDALGGMIHLITKSPTVAVDKNFITTGTAFTRYSSANHEKTIHADVNIGGKKLAWLQSYNFSSFGDMKMGNHYRSDYPDFGRRKNYISSINGQDTILSSADDRVQKYSGYKQWDIIQKLLFKQSEKVSHLLNLQFSNTNNVPRYDRLQDIRNGNLRYAEWYYGPQKRLLGAYELSAGKLGFVDEFKININYQDIEESRNTREFQRYDRFDSRVEKLKVFGTTVSGRKLLEHHEITVGLDVQLNDLKSTATRKNLITNEITSLDTRYPDGKNNMNNFGIYGQHVYKFPGEKLVLNDGLRIQVINLKSNVDNNSFFHLPVTKVRQNEAAITGNIGLVYTLNKNTVLKSSISSGFRSPNIDDLSKIFESSTANKQVVIPNADLKPEYTYNIDLSLNKTIAEKIHIEFTGYYTLFRNAIVKAPFTLNGEDSILYNSITSQVLANQNVNCANLYGFSTGMDISLTKEFSIYTTFTYSYGRFKTLAASKSTIYEKQPNGTYMLVQRSVSSKPLDHIPPVFGKTTISFERSKFSTQIYFLYNGWKHLHQFNADGEDNAQYATISGMPSWFTTNWKAQFNLTKTLLFQLSVENILDRNYRYFSSGYSAPGRNIGMAVRANW